MRKNSRTTLFLFLLAGILILYMIASENPALRLFSIAPRASGRYTIVTSDMWSVDSQIRDFATWRQAQGFTMSTVSLSQIYSAYPIPSYPSSPLKVQTIYGVTGSRIEGSVLYYRVGSGISLFGIVNLSGAYYAKSSPATPQDLFVWCSNYWISEISLTIDYSDGSTRKSITIKPRICPYKQDVIVLSSGQVQALETGAWSVARYLESYGSDYLLIIGDETVVPAFPAKYFVFGFSGGDLTISSGVCDDPYWKAPWSLFVWSRAVGRIPTTSISNVYSVLTKTRSAAFNTKRALYFKGDPLDVSPSAWDADYNALVSSTFTNGLHVWDPRYTKTEYDKPTDAIMRSALNSGNDFVFIFAHGNPGNFYITSTVWLSASDLASILFSQSMVMFTLSCEVADFSKACILESFLFDSDSRTVATFGSPILTSPSEAKDLVGQCVRNFRTYRSIGKAMLEARKSVSISQGFSYCLFGDPAIGLPAPIGTLKAQGFLNDSPVSFQLWVQNSTWQSTPETVTSGYTMSLTVGSYTVFAKYGDEELSQSTIIKAADTVTVSFFFTPPWSPQHGFLRTKAEVNGVGVTFKFWVSNSSWTRPAENVFSGYLLELPVGEYEVFGEYYGQRLSLPVTIIEGATTTVTFPFTDSFFEDWVWLAVPIMTVALIGVGVYVGTRKEEIVLIRRVHWYPVFRY